MTYDEALSLYKLIRPIVPGLIVKEREIEHLFIAPTDKNKFVDFMNTYMKEGKSAIVFFKTEELSVYGATKSEESDYGIQKVGFTILDSMKFELMN